MHCPIHLGEKVKKAIEKKGATLIYLSPYSPDFSPIKNLWSKLKIILRSIKTTNYQKLGKAIEFAFGQVTSSNIFNWFRHCCYCTSSVLRKAILNSPMCQLRVRNVGFIEDFSRDTIASITGWDYILWEINTVA
jgi:hypothetical protein